MNAHQRRIARRSEQRISDTLSAGASDDWLDWLDDHDERDEREVCDACGGDGRDPMTDYLLPCEVCCGDGFFD